MGVNVARKNHNGRPRWQPDFSLEFGDSPSLSCRWQEAFGLDRSPLQIVFLPAIAFLPLVTFIVLHSLSLMGTMVLR